MKSNSPASQKRGVKRYSFAVTERDHCDPVLISSAAEGASGWKLKPGMLFFTIILNISVFFVWFWQLYMHLKTYTLPSYSSFFRLFFPHF